ncbi:hypothetical protein [Solwaraspora sp. WMMD792]|uniref:hypothetical protein n=1 Tax=Micromonosporaceae TaxID=28056 RepID=UPI0024178727|nr:hypothetical protein [Solwaraspora sp. WMMD792]MDG4770494.1 hypothetical protein [Solwaraspora sp. WMMD792]
MDLVGTSELRAMLGTPEKPVSKQRAYVVSRSKGFPDPVARLAQGPVWLKADVERWIQENRPPRAS